jgi:hypothetical protein
MAIGMLQTLSGLTKEQYDKISDLLEFDTRPPKGLIFHAAGQASSGWRVFDIWESQDAWDRFLKDRLAPAFEKAGIQNRPNPPESFPIHNTYLSDAKSLSTRAKGAGSR